MKILVAGGHGMVGEKLVARLRHRGHEVVAASRRSGVDAATGAGLRAAMRGVEAVVDVTNAPSFEAPQVVEFFERSSAHLLDEGRRAGIGHYVVLSVVGTPRLQASAYFRAKALQERRVAASGLPFTVLRATQFFEFIASIVPPFGAREPIGVSPSAVRPVAAEDVADRLADLVDGPPVGGTVEMAGPEVFRLCDLLQWIMYCYQDARTVAADPAAPYYGGLLDDATLTPGEGALLGPTPFRDWLDAHLSGAVRRPDVHHPHPMAYFA